MFRNGAVVVREVVLKRAKCFVNSRVSFQPFVRRNSSSKHPPSFINAKATSSSIDETDESSDEEADHNKTPYPTIDLAKWVDTTVTALNGKVFPAPKAVIAPKKAAPFPTQQCFSLLDDSMVSVPHDIDSEIKVVMFSFRHYGFSLLRSWMDELENEANFKKYTKRPKTGSCAIPAPSYKVIEICYVETGILSIAKHLTAKNLRSKLEQHRLPLAFVKYGGIMVSSESKLEWTL